MSDTYDKASNQRHTVGPVQRDMQLRGPMFPLLAPNGTWLGFFYTLPAADQAGFALDRGPAFDALVAALKMCREELIALREHVIDNSAAGMFGPAARDATEKIGLIDATLKLAEAP